jgi:hypothetical protein
VCDWGGGSTAGGALTGVGGSGMSAGGTGRVEFGGGGAKVRPPLGRVKLACAKAAEGAQKSATHSAKMALRLAVARG